ncbi:MAG TPA: M14 family metallopeptidase [Caulobacteraceae bacterium]|jgi:hypothetical protein|nr:M14 family metallopeptidase [Caulobacteraceae bacterium]
MASVVPSWPRRLATTVEPTDVEPTTNPYAPSPFSPDYTAARRRFRDAAAAAGARLTQYKHPAPGPDGGGLATDVAWVGPEGAAAVVVLVSGTHGVEGYCGSAAQIDWLARAEAAELPEDAAVLLIHALNPHGFAWDRRVNEDNVDLNRNWVDFEGRLPRNPHYADIAAALCPAQWTDASRKATTRELHDYRTQRGLLAFQHAVSAGQYEFPDGLFYGGDRPSWSRRTLAAIAAQHLGRAARVAFIDYHTGLGPAGFGTRIVAGRPGAPEYLRAAAWWGAGLDSPKAGDSPSADVKGDWLSSAGDLAPQAETGGIVLEFGTVPILAVLEALRASNWLHAHGQPLSGQGDAIRAAMRAAFDVDHDVWRGMVLGQSLIAVRQAVAAVAG